VLLADKDKDNLECLKRLFQNQLSLRPKIWQNGHTLEDFLGAPGEGVIFVRIDDPSIMGLEMTKQMTAIYPKIQIVWMAAGEKYAIDAFPRGVDAYLLLPATEEKLAEVMNTLNFKKIRYGEK
jgi:two-component SAPR family response regulator